MRRRLTEAASRQVMVLGLVAILVASAGCRRGPAATPDTQGRVADAADVLSSGQRRSIADYLEFVESERGVDFRVVVLGDSETDLAREALTRYEALDIGSRTAGRGLLLLVDAGGAEARVEVGYELEDRVRDAEASSMIRELLAPYFATGNVAAGIEAATERLVEILEPTRQEISAASPLIGSGGAGATAALLEGIDSLTPETRVRLAEILVPQPRPEDCVNLELALMHRGIYYRDAPMYDEAWRRANRPDLPARRLKAIAREWDGPFAVETSGDHAITYYTGEKAKRWGPQFLRRTDEGWIVEASAVARYIVYDYANNAWYALDGDYPYLGLVKRVYDMRRVSLRQRGAAWMIDGAAQ